MGGSNPALFCCEILPMQDLSSAFLEPLPQLLAESFGSKAVSARFQVLNQHNDYYVLSVQVDPSVGEVIVKLAGPTTTMAATFERTALIHRLLNTYTDVPVADIV